MDNAFILHTPLPHMQWHGEGGKAFENA